MQATGRVVSSFYVSSEIDKEAVSSKVHEKVTMENLFDLDNTLIEDLYKKIAPAEKEATQVARFLEGLTSDKMTFLKACATGEIATVKQALGTDKQDVFAVSWLIDYRDMRAKTGLHLAAITNQGKVVEELIKGGFDPNIKDDYKGSICRTPLHDAVIYQSGDAVKALLASGKCSVDIKDAQGWAPLHYAVKTADTELVLLLCENGADIYLGTELERSPQVGKNAFSLALMYGCLDVLNELVALEIKKAEEIAEETAEIKAEEIAEEKVKKIENAQEKERAKIKEKAKAKAEIKEKVKAELKAKFYQKSLAEHLYDISCRDELRWFFTDKYDMSKVLTDSGKLDEYYQPLIKSMVIFRAVIRLLKKENKDVSEVTKKLSAQAARLGNSFASHTLSWLQDQNSKTNPEISQVLTRRSAVSLDPNALHDAAKGGNVTVINDFLKKGAKKNTVNSAGDLPLHIAAKKGHFEAVKLLKEPELLARKNEKERTPLVEAARKMHDTLFGELLSDKVDDCRDEALTSLLYNFYLDDNHEAEPLKAILDGAAFLLNENARVDHVGDCEKTAVQIVEENPLSKHCGLYDLVMNAKKKQSAKEQETKTCDLNVEASSKPLVPKVAEDGAKMDELGSQMIVVRRDNKNEPKVSRASGEPVEVSEIVAKMSVLTVAEENLSRYIRFLRERESLKGVDDVFSDLSANGCNVLHLIAKESDFSVYKEVLAKYRMDEKFHALLEQQITEAEDDFFEGMTPLHMICYHHNLPMLEFLLAIPDVHVVACLKQAGEKPTKVMRRNVFHCLADYHKAVKADSLIDEAIAIEMFKKLFALYTNSKAVNLLRQQDACGQNVIVHSAESGYVEWSNNLVNLIAKSCRFITHDMVDKIIEGIPETLENSRKEDPKRKWVMIGELDVNCQEINSDFLQLWENRLAKTGYEFCHKEFKTNSRVYREYKIRDPEVPDSCNIF